MLRHLPNVLTSLRIALLPVLVWLALIGDRSAFGGVVLACLAGDALDGTIARALRATSATGALFDSLADVLLLIVAVGGIAILYPTDVGAHPVAFWSIPAAWLIENGAAILRYGRLSSFHTYLSRAAAVAMGVFGVVLFAHGFQPVLLQFAAVTVALATLEELVLLYLLPEWRADVRGVPWVLSRGDRGTESRDTRGDPRRG